MKLLEKELLENTHVENIDVENVEENNIVKNFEIDTKNILVLLIGVSEFPEDTTIHPIPNILKNIELMKSVLLDKNCVGIPEENIVISLNETKLNISRKLQAIAKETKNKKYTLFVYYTGHGLLSSNDYKLYLSTSNSTKNTLETDSLNISDFRNIISKSRAGRKIVILDACHSGQIHNHMSDFQSKLIVELNKFEGTYTITSASEEDSALFPEYNSELPTYFTGFFVDTVKNGIHNGKQLCTLKDIYNAIVEKVRDHDLQLPMPQQSNYKNADEIIFCKNNRYDIKEAENEQWGEAILKHNAETYKRFILLFPNSNFVATAKELVTMLDYEKIIAQRTAELNTETINSATQLIVEEKIDNKKTPKVFKIKYLIRFLVLFLLMTIAAAIFIYPKYQNPNTTNSTKMITTNDSIKINKKTVTKKRYNKIDELILLAENQINKGEEFYLDALATYKTVLQQNPNYPEIKNKIDKLNTLIQNRIAIYKDEANMYLEVRTKENLEKAIIRLKKAKLLNPNDIDLNIKINQLQLELESN